MTEKEVVNDDFLECLFIAGFSCKIHLCWDGVFELQIFKLKFPIRKRKSMPIKRYGGIVDNGC